MIVGLILAKQFSGNRLTINPGGKGANQAVLCGTSGRRGNYGRCIGGDMYGELIAKTLKKTNIDATYVKVLPGEHTGTAHITVAENDNTIIIVIKALMTWLNRA